MSSLHKDSKHHHRLSSNHDHSDRNSQSKQGKYHGEPMRTRSENKPTPWSAGKREWNIAIGFSLIWLVEKVAQVSELITERSKAKSKQSRIISTRIENCCITWLFTFRGIFSVHRDWNIIILFKDQFTQKFTWTKTHYWKYSLADESTAFFI